MSIDDQMRHFNVVPPILFYSVKQIQEIGTGSKKGKHHGNSSPVKKRLGILKLINFLKIFISSWKAGADKMTKKINTLSGLLNPSSRRIVFLQNIAFLIDGKDHMAISKTNLQRIIKSIEIQFNPWFTSNSKAKY